MTDAATAPAAAPSSGPASAPGADAGPRSGTAPAPAPGPGPGPGAGAGAEPPAGDPTAHAPTRARSDGPRIATTVSPRDLGLPIGSLIVQHVPLGDVEPRELPAPGRVGAWFERRETRRRTDRAGRRWLDVEYQLVNAPDEPVQVELPALRLPAMPLRSTPPNAPSPPAADDAGQTRWLHVDPHPVGIVPITPRLSAWPGPLPAKLRPDRLLPAPEPAALWREAAASGAASAGALAVLGVATVLRRRHAAMHRPFARACRIVLRDPAGDAAWHALHAAFDATAGRSIGRESVDVLLATAPWLAALRAPIDGFFARSEVRFFARPPAAAGEGSGVSPAGTAGGDAPAEARAEATALEALARRLRRAEAGAPGRRDDASPRPGAIGGAAP